MRFFPKRGLPVTVVIVISLGGLAMLAVGLVSLASFKIAERNTIELTRDKAGMILDAIQGRIRSHLEPIRTLVEKLARPVSLVFERDTLEASLKLLSDEMGIPVVILGNDLKLDGITKNQSFGIDLKEKPAAEILQRILFLANPDKTAKKLSDPQQKLIYVLKPKYQDGEDTILITTRAQAAARGDTLPAVFTSGE